MSSVVLSQHTPQNTPQPTPTITIPNCIRLFESIDGPYEHWLEQLNSDVESNPDELPTYAQVQVLSPNQHGDEDEDWVDKCSNCTILPLTWSDPPLNTSPTPGPPMVPIPYIQPSPSRPYPSSKYTQPRAQSPDTLTSTHTPSTYDSSSPHRTHETPLGLTSLTPNLSTTHMGLDEGRTNRNAPLSKSIQHRRNIAPALGDRIHIPPLVDISKFVV
ncbi:hypothetical protein BASA84_000283 [Batrachochytrium salamandrivorans]|nr:hypothetical protein BASA84_000283 [Batrachochytrium salamandrivorans]